jgi:circadian clock protein KaiC
MILLAGTPGSGKTIFASQLLHEGLKANEPEIYVSFAEDNATFLRNMHKLEMDFEKYEKNKRFKYLDLVTVKEKGITSIFERVFAEIHSIKAKRLVIDSISALNQAFERKIDARMLLHTVLGKISRTMGVTTMLISIEEEASSAASSMVSALMDNIISLRHVEIESALKRSLVIFKARGTAHDRDIREFEITLKGMIVKGRFAGLEQVLGGAPRRTVATTEEVAESWARAFGEKNQEGSLPLDKTPIPPL